MKIIKENDCKALVILQENDIIEISALNGNKEHFEVKCLNSSLHINEFPFSKVKEKSIEEKEILKMKEYLQDKK